MSPSCKPNVVRAADFPEKGALAKNQGTGIPTGCWRTEAEKVDSPQVAMKAPYSGLNILINSGNNTSAFPRQTS